MKVDISTRARVDLVQVIDSEKTTNFGFGLNDFKTIEKHVLVMTAKYSYKGQDYEEELELEPEKLTQTRNVIIDKVKDNITKIQDKERAINYSETIELGV